MKYQYKALDQYGRRQKGVIEAAGLSAALRDLLGQQYSIIDIDEAKSSSAEIKLKLPFNKAGVRDLAVMTRQLAAMTAAGLPILKSFRVLAEQTENQKLREVISSVGEDIGKGFALWQGMSKHPEVFSEVYINMIKAGESGGVLDKVLDSLSGYMERERQIKAKIRSASLYPLIIMLLAIVMAVFIITFVMPAFIGVYLESGVSLPAPTRFLLGMSSFMEAYWQIIVPVLAITAYILRRFCKTPAGALLIDHMMLKMPFIGKNAARMNAAQFARIMGLLLKAGVSVLQSLHVVRDAAGNLVIKKAIQEAIDRIGEGESIAGPLEASGAFEPMVTQIIAVGEETGALDEMLIRMADFFDQEIMNTVDTITAVIEPVLILMAAALVGGTVLAAILPVFDMATLVN